jgi:hypothetical protein
MNGHRQAALMLHQLGDPDRRWLIEQVAAADRAVLEDLLAELAQLHIPRDAGIAVPVRGNADRAAAPAAATGLGAATAGQVYALLAAEPAWLAAAVLASGPWPWEAAYMEMLDGSARQRLRALARETLPERVRVRLCEQMELALARLGPLPPAPVVASPRWRVFAERLAARWATWRK